MLGERIEDLGLPSEAMPTDHVCVKEAVLPFDRFAGSDALLGPEMRSTGEVMGIARDFPTAFAKAQAAAGATLPDGGHGLHHRHRRRQGRRRRGSPRCSATSASASSRRPARRARSAAWACASTRCSRRSAARAPNVIDCIDAGEVDLIINTPTGSGARADGWEIRRAAVARGIPCITTLSGGHAAARAIAARRAGEPSVAVAAGDPPRTRSRVVVSRDEGPGAVRPAPRAGRPASTRSAPTASCTPPTSTARSRGRASSTCSPRSSAGGRGRTSGRSCRARCRFSAPRTAS